MSWHYQIRRIIWSYSGKSTYDLVEVYRNPFAQTGYGVRPVGESRRSVIRQLEMMLRDAKKYKTLTAKG